MEDDDHESDDHVETDDRHMDHSEMPDSDRTKPRSPHYQANDRGGFGNPPVKTQFKKGGKGGPGRPKGVTNLESAMRKIVGQKMTVNKQGKSIKMMPAEIFAERTMEAILSKTRSTHMLEYGRKLLSQYGPEDSSKATEPDYSVLNDDEFEILHALWFQTVGLKPIFPEPGPFGVLSRIEGTYRITRRDNGHIRITRVEGPENWELDCEKRKG